MGSLLLAVHRAALNSRGGIDGLAPMLSSPGEKPVNHGTLRNQLTGNERHRLSIDMAERIIDLADSDELAHAAAQQRGGVFVKLPKDGAVASDLAVLELVTHVWRANGDVGRAVDETLADGKVEFHEIAEVRKAIYKMQHAMTSMLARLEEMAE